MTDTHEDFQQAIRVVNYSFLKGEFRFVLITILTDAFP